MTGDKWIYRATVAAVFAVAAVAAWVSFRHTVTVVSGYGEPGMLYPVTFDGLIVAASMVLLDAHRHEAEATPRLAWAMLAAGIAGTLAMNVMAGSARGPVGAIIAAWPAAAFVGCVELLMYLIRARAARVPVPGPDPFAGLNGHRAQAEELFAAEVAAGTIPTIRAIRKAMRIGQPKATQVRAYLGELARTQGRDTSNA